MSSAVVVDSHSSAGLWSGMTSQLRECYSILTLNTRAKKVSQERNRSDTVIALPSDHIFSSVNSSPELVLSSQSSGTALSQEAVKFQFSQRYALEKVIGKGASATVFDARDRMTSSRYACKIVTTEFKNRMNDSKTMRLEAMVMKKLDHPNIVKMHELYETADRLCLVMERADCSLLEGLQSLPVYSEAAIAQLFKQMLCGVEYLHSKGIVHRDLKMDNLLCVLNAHGSNASQPLTVKITDFGLSAITIKREGDVLRTGKHLQSLTEVWGTQEYMAPEVLQKKYGFQADVWSLGYLLYEMLTGELAFPFQEEDAAHKHCVLKRLPHRRRERRHFETTANWSALSSSAQSLIRGMLKRDPRKRWSIEECLRHEWIVTQGQAVSDFSSSSLSKSSSSSSLASAVSDASSSEVEVAAVAVPSSNKYCEMGVNTDDQPSSSPASSYSSAVSTALSTSTESHSDSSSRGHSHKSLRLRSSCVQPSLADVVPPGAVSEVQNSFQMELANVREALRMRHERKVRRLDWQVRSMSPQEKRMLSVPTAQ